MEEQYKSILVHYIAEGGEPDLELAYELGRQAIDEGIGVLQVVDAHYQALSQVLQQSGTPHDSAIVAQRAASLLKEALAPFEMARMGYADTIAILRDQNEKLRALMEERSRLLQQREDFMMVVTHDLKTPINAADRCLTLMLEGDFGDLNPNQLEVLATMKDSNQRMFTMVKNLLDVYKYDQQTPILNLTRVNILPLIMSTLKSFSLSAQMRGLTLAAVMDEEPNAALADENAIRHVLTNLVDNAVKFTPKGGTITLAASNAGSDIVLEVRDTGRGIKQEDIDNLFQRFFQSESGRKQYTGTGLGLFLCRQIVRAHGGDIQCQSQLDVGTIFWFTLPAYAD